MVMESIISNLLIYKQIYIIERYSQHSYWTMDMSEGSKLMIDCHNQYLIMFLKY